MSGAARVAGDEIRGTRIPDAQSTDRYCPVTERLTPLADTTRNPVGIGTYIAGRLGREGRAVSRP
jgi:hypothetical protein